MPTLTPAQGRRLWLQAQRLTEAAPFGGGAAATGRAVEHLGYVQIDTIHVIERSHHHILFTRIPDYRREHLHRALSIDKSVFEYWTHALSYVPTRDLRFFLGAMHRHRRAPGKWYARVTSADTRKVLRLLKQNGAFTIRDIDDDELVEKDHEWASRKPSKRALQLLFYSGVVTVSARAGMLKTYELMERHFGWARRPKPASQRAVDEYKLERTLRSQGVITLDSIFSMQSRARKPAMQKLIEAQVRRGELTPVRMSGAEKIQHWARPETLSTPPCAIPEDIVHILSPFDPLIIQRKRLEFFFDYAHRFEAYIPKSKRVFGYFGLPVLIGEQIVAVLDLKTDRQRNKLLVQQWTWVGRGRARAHKRRVEEALHRFERFQLAPRGARAAAAVPSVFSSTLRERK